MKHLSETAFNALCDKWRDAPGIVRGIRAAHRAAGGSYVPDFNDIFGI